MKTICSRANKLEINTTTLLAIKRLKNYYTTQERILGVELEEQRAIVKTLDHKMNIYFNLEPMSTLDIFTPLYKGSS